MDELPKDKLNKHNFLTNLIGSEVFEIISDCDTYENAILLLKQALCETNEYDMPDIALPLAARNRVRILTSIYKH